MCAGKSQVPTQVDRPPSLFIHQKNISRKRFHKQDGFSLALKPIYGDRCG